MLLRHGNGQQEMRNPDPLTVEDDAATSPHLLAHCVPPVLPPQDGGEEVLDGLRVKRAGRKGKAGAAAGAAAAAEAVTARRPALERPVCNCLACGKVYDCRGTISVDTAAFLGAPSAS